MENSQKPLIWLIDYNHWERANIGALLIERGFKVEGFVSISHAVMMFHREIVEKPTAVVLEIKGLPYRSTELTELMGIGAPVILLTGVYEDSEVVDKHKWGAVLRRPFSIGQLAEVVERLLGKN